jgi:arylsulfatase I/J
MAMTHYLDDTIRNLTDAFKAKGMWDDTLVVFISDNGGPVYEPGSANNYPLRGGKFTDFDGGVRTNAFMSGGYIPKASRGRIHDTVVSVADWYTIFSELAEVDPVDQRAEAANPWLAERGLSTLPPVDGQKGMLWHIFAGTDGRRGPLFLSANAVLDFPYKLITGKFPYDMHTGPVYPNCSTVNGLKQGKGPAFTDGTVFGKKLNFGDAAEFVGDCENGCLFNVEEDPSERRDLSQFPDFQPRLKSMLRELSRMNTTLFEPDRGTTHVQACYSAMLNGGGHFGPFAHIEGYYTDKPRTFSELSLSEMASMAKIKVMEFNPLQKISQAAATPIFWEEFKFYDKCEGPEHHSRFAWLLGHNGTGASANDDLTSTTLII